MDRRPLLLCDIGGVLLSNGWDLEDRKAACRAFGLDEGAFEARHHRWVDKFERGRISLAVYLQRTVPDAPPPFSPESFRQFMFARSFEFPGAIAAAERLRSTDRYLWMALNNESRELNDHRIRSFGLDRLFDGYLTSAYTGRRKPEPDAYRHALELLHRTAREALFVDDREENIDAARSLGIPTLHVDPPGSLAESLKGAGIRSE